MKHLLLILCLVTSCGASCEDDYLDQPAPMQRLYDHAILTRAAWLSRGLPALSSGCEFVLNQTGRFEANTPGKTQLVVAFLPQNMLQSVCGEDARLYGCLIGNTICVTDKIRDTLRVDYVVERELRHWFAGCSYGSIDGAHKLDEIWFPYRGVDVRL